ncbi:hypothetical protein LTR60_003887, partial [Cryomyces antarcticus]
AGGGGASIRERESPGRLLPSDAEDVTLCWETLRLGNCIGLPTFTQSGSEDGANGFEGRLGFGIILAAGG